MDEQLWQRAWSVDVWHSRDRPEAMLLSGRADTGPQMLCGMSRRSTCTEADVGLVVVSTWGGDTGAPAGGQTTVMGSPYAWAEDTLNCALEMVFSKAV